MNDECISNAIEQEYERRPHKFGDVHFEYTNSNMPNRLGQLLLINHTLLQLAIRAIDLSHNSELRLAKANQIAGSQI